MSCPCFGFGHLCPNLHSLHSTRAVPTTEPLQPPLLPGIMRISGVVVAEQAPSSPRALCTAEPFTESQWSLENTSPCPFLLLRKRAALTLPVCVVLSELTSSWHPAWHPAETELLFFFNPRLPGAFSCLGPPGSKKQFLAFLGLSEMEKASQCSYSPTEREQNCFFLIHNQSLGIFVSFGCNLLPSSVKRQSVVH